MLAKFSPSRRVRATTTSRLRSSCLMRCTRRGEGVVSVFMRLDWWIMSTIMPKSLDHVNQSGRSVAEEVFEAIHEVMHLYRSERRRASPDGEEALSHMEAK